LPKNQKKWTAKENFTGRSLLSFLKADVDNLGLIFSIGLGDNLSVARLASLSRRSTPYCDSKQICNFS
jgi:CRISPR/Cas system-associated protein Cas10 (large subunit of type III CRISPR-Cas system)